MLDVCILSVVTLLTQPYAYDGSRCSEKKPTFYPFLKLV